MSARSYSPSIDVRAAHLIPHIPGSFNVNLNDMHRSYTYLRALLVFPVSIFVITFIAVIIFHVVFYWDWLREKITCFDRSRYRKNRAHFLSFVILNFSAFIMANLIYIGHSFLTTGLADAFSGMSDFSSVFTDLRDVGREIEASGRNIADANNNVQEYCCTSSSCSNQTIANDVAVNEYYVGVHSMSDSIESNGQGICTIAEDLVGYVNAARRLLRGNGIMLHVVTQSSRRLDESNMFFPFIGSFVYAYCPIMIFLLCLFILSGLLKNKYLLKWFVFGAEAFIIILSFLCCAVTPPLILVADFCMDPNSNALRILDKGTVHDVIGYYISCTGESIVGNFLTDAVSYTQNITHFYENLVQSPSFVPTSSCSQALSNITASVAELTYPLNSMIKLTQCVYLNEAWHSTVGTALCHTAYSGFFEIWLSVFLTSVILFGSAGFASLMFVSFENERVFHETVEYVPCPTCGSQVLRGTFGDEDSGVSEIENLNLQQDLEEPEIAKQDVDDKQEFSWVKETSFWHNWTSFGSQYSKESVDDMVHPTEITNQVAEDKEDLSWATRMKSHLRDWRQNFMLRT